MAFALGVKRGCKGANSHLWAKQRGAHDSLLILLHRRQLPSCPAACPPLWIGKVSVYCTGSCVDEQSLCPQLTKPEHCSSLLPPQSQATATMADKLSFQQLVLARRGEGAKQKEEARRGETKKEETFDITHAHTHDSSQAWTGQVWGLRVGVGGGVVVCGRRHVRHVTAKTLLETRPDAVQHLANHPLPVAGSPQRRLQLAHSALGQQLADVRSRLRNIMQQGHNTLS